MSVMILEKHGTVAVLTLNRPDALNALGMLGDGVAVRTVCEQVNADPEIRAVVLTGAGRAFSAGGDVKSMLAKTGIFAGSGTSIRENYRREFQMLSKAIFDLDVPVIAAVNGPAIGLGCDIACLADVRIGSDQAKFGVTFLKVGLIPGDGGTWLLPRVLGYSRAAELLFSGDVIDAPTAAQWGLISHVVPHAELLSFALTRAARFAAQPPHALRLCKALLRQGRSASYESMLELSSSAQALCHLTDDHLEGVGAVLEKRQADFRGF